MRCIVAICCLLLLTLGGCADISPYASEEYVDEQVDVLASGFPEDQSARIDGELAEIRARQESTTDAGALDWLDLLGLSGGTGAAVLAVLRLIRGSSFKSGSGRRKKAADQAARRVDVSDQATSA